MQNQAPTLRKYETFLEQNRRAREIRQNKQVAVFVVGTAILWAIAEAIVQLYIITH